MTAASEHPWAAISIPQLLTGETPCFDQFGLAASRHVLHWDRPSSEPAISAHCLAEYWACISVSPHMSLVPVSERKAECSHTGLVSVLNRITRCSHLPEFLVGS